MFSGVKKMEDALLTIFRLRLFETLRVIGALILTGMTLGVLEHRANFYVQSVFGTKASISHFFSFLQMRYVVY
ncbi:predicted protein [Methanosarcina acetivorans C2A]|uniref:Uncharacterized protein n=1 Tax=Methanosarcina acetivorans (strain ATCC 35395 / DSM 2834 / JCM 12185 / C2A) TaxID=188937 RepID=Q8TNW0_METAC|nr:predicted protein [Methanosarcina acetivorans C2A]